MYSNKDYQNNLQKSPIQHQYDSGQSSASLNNYFNNPESVTMGNVDSTDPLGASLNTMKPYKSIPALKYIIENQAAKITDIGKQLQTAKLFHVINTIPSSFAISNYFKQYSFVPSTSSREELLARYFLFYTSYKEMSRNLIKSFLPYISEQFRHQFDRIESRHSFLDRMFWPIAIGLLLYKSKRMDYKWKKLTISPRFGIYSFIGLVTFDTLTYRIYMAQLNSLVRKNIFQFDSLVKTQEFIFYQFMKRQSQKRGQTAPNIKDAINIMFPNYSVIPPAKTII